ncbi:Kelch repeat-containing protein [Planctomycetota bacterium]
MRKLLVVLVIFSFIFSGFLAAQEAAKDAQPDKDKKDKPPTIETTVKELIEQIDEAESKIKQTIDALIKLGLSAKPLLEKAIQLNSNPKIKKHLEMVLDSYVWTALAECPLEPRQNHTAIWTGKEMIIWGGRGKKEYNNGARYNPNTDEWTMLPESPLETRQNHTAIWIPSASGLSSVAGEMIIWGGCSGTDKRYNDGARYNPKKDKWNKLPRCPVEGRDGHVAIWTGYEMIIWGGLDKENKYPDVGISYAPTKNRWYKLPKSPIKGRVHAAAVWTDKEIIIWGGRNNTEYYLDGAILDPVKRNWEKISEGPFNLDKESKTPSYPPAAIWNDKRMIIWGVNAQQDGIKSDIVSYSKSSDTWELCHESPVRDKTYITTAWTGKEIIACAGQIALYNPLMGSWQLLPQSRMNGTSGHSLVWTNKEIIIWGGARMGTPLTEGVRHEVSE